jgi:hypothetical protein
VVSLQLPTWAPRRWTALLVAPSAAPTDESDPLIVQSKRMSLRAIWSPQSRTARRSMRHYSEISTPNPRLCSQFCTLLSVYNSISQHAHLSPYRPPCLYGSGFPPAAHRGEGMAVNRYMKLDGQEQDRMIECGRGKDVAAARQSHGDKCTARLRTKMSFSR